LVKKASDKIKKKVKTMTIRDWAVLSATILLPLGILIPVVKKLHKKYMQKSRGDG